MTFIRAVSASGKAPGPPAAPVPPAGHVTLCTASDGKLGRGAEGAGGWKGHISPQSASVLLCPDQNAELEGSRLVSYSQ